MSHLGPLVSAYVDGQLPPAEAERAGDHVAVCPECQAQVLAEGAGRRAARQARPVRAGEDLTQRLLALEDAAASNYLPDEAADTGRARRAPGLKVMTGALASVGLIAVALFALGGTQREVDLPALVAQDPGAVTTPDRAAGGDTELSATVLDWMADTGWAAPQRLPAGMSVQQVTSSAEQQDTVRLGLSGHRGGVWISEQHGVLSASEMAAMDAETIGGRRVYRLGDHSWVVQCGDSVVAVSSSQNPRAARALVASLPHEAGPDMLERMQHGFEVLVGRA